MSALVKCKACEKEIAKGVKKCPSCGKDQRNWVMRHKILTLIGAIILIVIVSSLAGGNEGEKVATSDETKTSKTKEETVYQVGDTVSTKTMDVTITKYEELDVIGDPEFLGKTASDGGTLVAIQYTMKNTSDKPIGMFSYPSIKLVDENGTKFSTDIEGSSAYAVETKIDNSKVMSDLNPDISVTAVDVFEVSKAKFAEGKWYIEIGDLKTQLK